MFQVWYFYGMFTQMAKEIVENNLFVSKYWKSSTEIEREAEVDWKSEREKEREIERER